MEGELVARVVDRLGDDVAVDVVFLDFDFGPEDSLDLFGGARFEANWVMLVLVVPLLCADCFPLVFCAFTSVLRSDNMLANRTHSSRSRHIFGELDLKCNTLFPDSIQSLHEQRLIGAHFC